MDTSLFSKYQLAQASAAHAVGTSLAPKIGTNLNVRNAAGTASPITARTATPAATTGTTGTTSSTSSAATDGATITSSDFLTLLVSELKNQDPTTPTDPTQYISQLVGVNSLEQLIAINTGISSLDTAAGATGTGSSTGSAVPAASAVPALTTSPAQQAAVQTRLATGFTGI